MGDASYAAEVVRMSVANTHLPVSVKLRAGQQNDLDYLTHFVEGLVGAGASWVTLHPRTAEQKRRGSADWSQIKHLRSRVAIPVIGNGDIQVADDVEAMLHETDCDMVMVGRALTARPWLLWQLGDRWGFPAPAGREGERAPVTPEEEGAEYGRSLLRLWAHMREHFRDDLALRKFRFHVKTGSPWLVFGLDLFARVNKAKTADEIESCLHEFFSRPHEMSERTELR
jgi:tRNA-dihydrouridine synthase